MPLRPRCMALVQPRASSIVASTRTREVLRHASRRPSFMTAPPARVMARAQLQALRQDFALRGRQTLRDIDAGMLVRKNPDFR